MKLCSILTITLVSMFSQCQDEFQESAITSVTFGTSFGMCAGYCTQIVTFSDNKVSKTVIPRLDPKLEEKTCTLPYDLNRITTLIDYEAFASLPETIGCPDCADGGAEWIEIATPEGTKKVTYEFQKEPDEVKSFINELRKYYIQLGKCD